MKKAFIFSAFTGTLVREIEYETSTNTGKYVDFYNGRELVATVPMGYFLIIY